MTNIKRLIESILDGGELASGRKTGKIKTGYWADILALDLSSFNYSSLNNDEKLNYLIFSESEKNINYLIPFSPLMINPILLFCR